MIDVYITKYAVSMHVTTTSFTVIGEYFFKCLVVSCVCIAKYICLFGKFSCFPLINNVLHLCL